MELEEARSALLALKAEYDGIPYPKYLNAELNVLEGAYDRLKGISMVLMNDPVFIQLKGSLLQTIKRCKRKGSWLNISERGMNKAIPPVLRKGGKNVEFPFHWENRKGRICSINSYWGARNYMTMDVLGYFFILKMGGNRVSRELSPIFRNLESVERRERELTNTRNIVPTMISSEEISTLTDNTYCVKFDDHYFRKFTGLKMSSNDILKLLLETSRVEFRIDFPVRILNKLNTRKPIEEKWYEMTVFSRPFEIGFINSEIRKDGIVQGRTYYIFFNTILGELFAHNLLTHNYDYIGNNLYNLPVSAQIFYRHFLLHHDFTRFEIGLDKIIKRMNFQDRNRSNLINSLETNTFEPLKRSGLILGYLQKEGLTGLKYEFTLPKKNKEILQDSANTEGSGVCK